jgi:hypothetical protein
MYSLDPLDRGLEIVLAEAVAVVALLRHRQWHGRRIAGRATTQAMDQLVKPALGPRPGIRLGRVGIDDQVRATGQVVEHGQFLGLQQQDLGHAELVGLGRKIQFRFDQGDGFVAEVTDQAAAETGQIVEPRRAGLATTSDRIERVDIVRCSTTRPNSSISTSRPDARQARRQGSPMIE